MEGNEDMGSVASQPVSYSDATVVDAGEPEAQGSSLEPSASVEMLDADYPDKGAAGPPDNTYTAAGENSSASPDSQQGPAASHAAGEYGRSPEPQAEQDNYPEAEAAPSAAGRHGRNSESDAVLPESAAIAAGTGGQGNVEGEGETIAPQELIRDMSLDAVLPGSDDLSDLPFVDSPTTSRRPAALLFNTHYLLLNMYDLLILIY